MYIACLDVGNQNNQNKLGTRFYESRIQIITCTACVLYPGGVHVITERQLLETLGQADDLTQAGLAAIPGENDAIICTLETTSFCRSFIPPTISKSLRSWLKLVS